MQILSPTQPFFYYSSFGNQKSNTAIFFLGYNLETLNPTQLLFLGDLLEVLYPTQPLFLGIFWKPEPNKATFLVDLLEALNPTQPLFLWIFLYVPFFYKERKRTQRLFRSFIKNGKERKDRSVLLKGTDAQPCPEPNTATFLGDLLEVLYPTQPLFLGIIWKPWTQHNHFSCGSFGNPEPNRYTSWQLSTLQYWFIVFFILYKKTMSWEKYVVLS